MSKKEKEKIYKKGTKVNYTLGSDQFPGCEITGTMTLDVDYNESSLSKELYEMALEHMAPTYEFEVD